jgi:hypothetical protein
MTNGEKYRTSSEGAHRPGARLKGVGASAWREEEDDLGRRVSDVAHEIVERENRRGDFQA